MRRFVCWASLVVLLCSISLCVGCAQDRAGLGEGESAVESYVIHRVYGDSGEVAREYAIDGESGTVYNISFRLYAGDCPPGLLAGSDFTLTNDLFYPAGFERLGSLSIVPSDASYIKEDGEGAGAGMASSSDKDLLESALADPAAVLLQLDGVSGESFSDDLRVECASELIAEGDGSFTETDFDDTANVVKRFDSEGHLIQRDEVDSETGEIRHSMLYERGSSARLTGIRYEQFYLDGSSETTSRAFEYDERGNVVRVTTFDEEGLLAREVMREYDEAGNPVSEITRDATGETLRESRCSYSSDGKLATLDSTDHLVSDGGEPMSWHYEYRYDELGRLIEVTIDDGSASGPSSRRFEYDERGNVIRDTDGTDGTAILTTYRYDAQGRLVDTGINVDLHGDAWSKVDPFGRFR